MGIYDELFSGSDFSGTGIDTSLVTGVVESIKDPEDLGRVRCTYTVAEKKAKLSNWAYVVTPFGGEGYGMYFRPNVGDTVLMGFEDGDRARPIILGSLWNAKEAKPPLPNPPTLIDNSKHKFYEIVTPAKHTISFLDDPKEGSISITTAKKLSVTIDDKEEQLLIKVKDNVVKIDGKGGEILIQPQKKLTLKVGSSKLVIDEQSIQLEATQIKVKSKGNLNIAADATATMEAAQMQIKGKATTKLEGGGMTEVKGGIVKIN